MQWFEEDFGGQENFPAIIMEYVGEDVSGYQFEYIPFDWTASFRNFKS
jgi:hypothetical protein